MKIKFKCNNCVYKLILRIQSSSANGCLIRIQIIGRGGHRQLTKDNQNGLCMTIYIKVDLDFATLGLKRQYSSYFLCFVS